MSQSEIIGTSTATGIDYNKVLVTTEGSLRIEKKLYRQNARLLHNGSTANTITLDYSISV